MKTQTRTTPNNGTRAAAARSPRRLQLPDGTRSVQSPWVWRGFLFLSFIALGLCLTFAVGDRVFYAAAWGFVTAGWFTISMWLWRRHVRDDDEWRARQRPGRTA